MSDTRQKEMSVSEKKKEDWMNTKWRPMMAWMYMAVCITDFIVFPILWSVIQAMHGGTVSDQWDPMTLQGAGLFHMAMGAILGIAVYGRTQEKMIGANYSGPTQPVSITSPSVVPSTTPFTSKAPPPAPTPQL